jgi:hypothetical protein
MHAVNIDKHSSKIFKTLLKVRFYELQWISIKFFGEHTYRTKFYGNLLISDLGSEHTNNLDKWSYKAYKQADSSQTVRQMNESAFIV